MFLFLKNMRKPPRQSRSGSCSPIGIVLHKAFREKLHRLCAVDFFPVLFHRFPHICGKTGKVLHRPGIRMQEAFKTVRHIAITPTLFYTGPIGFIPENSGNHIYASARIFPISRRLASQSLIPNLYISRSFSGFSSQRPIVIGTLGRIITAFFSASLRQISSSPL